MEQLKTMKECLIAQLQSQMSHLEYVDAEEMGEVVDMVKDLEEAIYYHTITEAMKNGDTSYYTEYRPHSYEERDYYRDMDRPKGRMYYSGKEAEERPYNMTWHDRREGRSPTSRKMYMESKEMRKDKSIQMQDLESYAQELTADIIEMIQDATAEEKALLQNKLTALAQKIK